jgi:serine/threonine protein kinase
MAFRRVSRQGPRLTTEMRPRDTGHLQETEGNQKKTFQGFEIGKKIGKGAYASVFMATEIKSHLIYALKTYEKPSLESKTRRTIVDREIEILKFVRHPNLISLYRVLDTKSHVAAVSRSSA